ncbi:hypothetical protein HS7_04190 [Sulfolobales archaeon HS-7]|nr:hypothetical protein HS7_04190 [Sulfolobales archaeon HS-7]
MRILVIGGGIAGSSVALLLRQRGIDVTIIDEGKPRVNSVLIHSLLLKDEDVNLAKRTLELYKKWNIILREYKSYTIGNIDERYLDQWHEAGVKVRRISIRELGAEAYEAVGGDRLVNIGKLITLSSPIRAKVKLTIENNTASIQGVSSNFDVIVLASGAWNGQMINAPLKSYYCWASLAITNAFAGSNIIYDYELGFYSRPFIGEGLPLSIVGDGEVLECPPKKVPKFSIFNVITKVNMRFRAIPIIVGGNFCEGTPDMRPVYGKVLENLYFIGGLNGYGAEVGPAVAEMLVNYIIDGFEDKRYSLGRFNDTGEFSLGREAHEF